MKGFFRFLIFLVFVSIVLLAFLFAVNNTTEIALWVGIDLPPVSVGVLVIGVFILGGLIGLLLGLGMLRQLKTIVEIRQLRSQVRKLQDGQHSGKPGSES